MTPRSAGGGHWMTAGGILLGLLVFVPVLAQWGLSRPGGPASEHGARMAGQLAQAGLDRGRWKLAGPPRLWDPVAGGAAVPGYRGDILYHDAAGGHYLVWLSSGAEAGSVTLSAEGVHAATGITRRITVPLTPPD